MTRVIGIDPSLTATGIAVISDNTCPETFTIKTKASQDLGTRYLTIYRECKELFYSWTGVIVIGVEQGFSGGSGPVAIKLGGARAAVLMALEASLIPKPYDVAPKARAAYATGSGGAEKEAVLASANKHFQYEGKSFDEADAITIAYFAAEIHLAKRPTWEFEPWGGWPKLGSESYDAVDRACNPRAKKG